MPSETVQTHRFPNKGIPNEENPHQNLRHHHTGRRIGRRSGRCRCRRAGLFPRQQPGRRYCPRQKITAALPPFVSVVALFVNESAQNIRRILAEVPIHIIQFHGDEDDTFCRQFDRPYIKAIRVQTASDIRNAADRFPDAQALLFDAYHPSEYGGTGHRFDWTLLAEYSGKPWVLAGGLTPENVGEAVRITGAEAVDVSGGVEASKGKKDPAKVAAFIATANRLSR